MNKGNLIRDINKILKQEITINDENVELVVKELNEKYSDRLVKSGTEMLNETFQGFDDSIESKFKNDSELLKSKQEEVERFKQRVNIESFVKAPNLLMFDNKTKATTAGTLAGTTVGGGLLFLLGRGVTGFLKGGIIGASLMTMAAVYFATKKKCDKDVIEKSKQKAKQIADQYLTKIQTKLDRLNSEFDKKILEAQASS